MAQNSHVPKFGNWESDDDIPYTAFFDNARKDDKPVNNVKMINPNDPEENPEAFMMMMQRRSRRTLEAGGDIASDHPPHPSVLQAAAVQPPRRLIKSTSTSEKSLPADEHTRHRHRANHGNNTTNSTFSKSPTSESGSDQKTSSDHSLLHRPDHGSYVRSDDHKKKSTSSGGGSDSSSASEQGRDRRRISGSNNHHTSDHLQHHQRTASIPKFGSWDVNDPTSGEGFTFIFEKVKEEKQSNGAVKFPTTSPPRHPTHYNGKDQIKPGRISSCISKICFCLRSSGSR